MARSVGSWLKSLLAEEGNVAGLPKLASKCAALSTFHLVKWKIAEHVCDWSFCLAVTRASHPVRRMSRQTRICLAVLLKELHIACPFWGCRSVLGVEDIWTHLHTNRPHFLHAWERNTDNTCWNLDKQQVADTVHKAPDRVRRQHGIHNTLSLSLAKGGLRLLDRVGHATHQLSVCTRSKIYWTL